MANRLFNLKHPTFPTPAAAAPTPEPEPERFTFFYGHHEGRSAYAECSRWFMRSFEAEGVVFNCCEQWMMWSKARLFGDAEAAVQILRAVAPGTQEALGRKVRGFDEGRWVRNRFDIACRGNLAKFSQHHDIRDRLARSAGTTLVEASRTDRIWGIGLSLDDPRRLDRRSWRGLNLGGQALTEVRITLCGA